MLFQTNGVPAPSVYILYATEVISLTSLCQFTWSVVRPSSVCLYRWSAFVCLRPAPRIIIHITVSAPRLDHRIFASPFTYAHLIQSLRLCLPALCYQDLLHPGKPLGDIQFFHSTLRNEVLHLYFPLPSPQLPPSLPSTQLNCIFPTDTRKIRLISVFQFTSIINWNIGCILVCISMYLTIIKTV